MSYIITPNNPAYQPISLQMTKAHLQVDFDLEDSIISLYIDSAVSLFEKATGTIIRPSTLTNKTEYKDTDIFPVRPKNDNGELIDGLWAYNVGYAPSELPADIKAILLDMVLFQYNSRGLENRTYPNDILMRIKQYTIYP